MKILTNHLGYDPKHPKKIIVKMEGSESFEKLEKALLSIKKTASHETVLSGPLKEEGGVARWKDWQFWSFDFSDLQERGRYYAELEMAGIAVTPNHFSHPFTIDDSVVPRTVISDILFYFKGQRCSGRWNQADKSAPFVGNRKERVDVSGGWYDASGDFSKYLSHLSYANFMNPQQIPMVVWNFLDARERLEPSEKDSRLQSLLQRLEEEALYGGDFLLRVLDPKGYFYMTVFDRWSKDPNQREVCSYRYQSGEKNEDYPAAYRQGGGIAIAALARLSTLNLSGDNFAQNYRKGAERAFAHLEEHNNDYCDDGKSNIIDFYCALLAASELHLATGKEIYLDAARHYRDLLLSCQKTDENFQNFWTVDRRGTRPYFHAAEAGLPGIALLRYLDAEQSPSEKTIAWNGLIRSLEHELDISEEVANPFGYARQYVQDTDSAPRSSFFIARKNESGYWWQGENARLGSLAALGFKLLASKDSARMNSTFKDRLQQWTTNQVNWILGLNPYDMCMLQGRGYHNPDYLWQYPNAPGGVVNGITAGFHDPEDIDFNPKDEREDMNQNWRWGEQWIPHGAWLLLAAASMARIDGKTRSIFLP